MWRKKIVQGDHTYICGEPNIIADGGEGAMIYIGNYCSVAGNSNWIIGGNHRYDWITTFPFTSFNKEYNINIPSIFEKKKKINKLYSNQPGCYSNGNIEIGNDVWIGYNCTIINGIKIGDGAVIAANSNVVSDVEPYSIVGGNPAKLIKYRFTKDQIDKLLKIQWWNWDRQKIKDNVLSLVDDDIDAFINKFI